METIIIRRGLDTTQVASSKRATCQVSPLSTCRNLCPLQHKFWFSYWGHLQLPRYRPTMQQRNPRTSTEWTMQRTQPVLPDQSKNILLWYSLFVNGSIDFGCRIIMFRWCTPSREPSSSLPWPTNNTSKPEATEAKVPTTNRPILRKTREVIANLTTDCDKQLVDYYCSKQGPVCKTGRLSRLLNTTKPCVVHDPSSK